MSACGSLQHIFENPLPENPTLLESLSLNQIKPIKSIDHSSSFTEIFGELHFKESPEPSPSSSSSSSSPHICTSSFTEIYHTKLGQNAPSGLCDINQPPSSAYVSSTPISNHTNSHKSSDSFSSLNSESLQLCTEGLGFESSDDVENSKTGMNECWETQRENEAAINHLPSNDSNGECKIRSRVNGGEYPPPISCIGRTGRPWVSFRSYRKNGRFVLKEIRIPTQEFLHAYREDGRLMLHFVQPDEELLEEKDEDEEEEDEEQEEEEDVDDYEEEDHDYVESIDEGEENMVRENDDSVMDQANEAKEIDTPAT